MTSKHKHGNPAQPAPAELQDEVLDAATGGILVGMLLPAVQKSSDAVVAGNFIGTNAAGTAG